MILFIYSAYFFTLVVTIVSDFTKKKLWIVPFFLILIILILLATFRDGSIMPDYGMYKSIFNSIGAGTNIYPIEISFIYLAKFSSLIGKGNFLVLLSLYAILGIGLKFYLIHKFSINVFYSILIFISNYYLIQDLVQIRSSVSVGLIYLGILYLLNDKKRLFIFFIILATIFHYSAFIFVLLYFISKNDYNKTRYYLLIIVAYIISFIGLNYLNLVYDLLPFQYLKLKLQTYFSTQGNQSQSINIFGIFILSKILLFAIFSYLHEVKSNNEFHNYLLKMYGLGIIVYVILSVAPVIAVRLSYVFFFSEIFLIPYYFLKIRPRFISKLLIIILSFLLLYSNINFTSLFIYFN